MLANGRTGSDHHPLEEGYNQKLTQPRRSPRLHPPSAQQHSQRSAARRGRERWLGKQGRGAAHPCVVVRRRSGWG